MFQSRAFRLIASAVGIVVLVCLMLFLSKITYADTGRTEPRTATPIEIAQAALEGQAEAMRGQGFNDDCIQEVLTFGERCVKRCVTQDSGFFISIALNHPNCSPVDCGCEGEEPVPVGVRHE